MFIAGIDHHVGVYEIRKAHQMLKTRSSYEQMTFTYLALLYLCIGCVKRAVEFYVTNRPLGTPARALIPYQPSTLLGGILRNAVAWPVLLLWPVALGLLKLFVLHRQSRRRDK